MWPHLQLEFEEVGSDRRAVDWPVAPGGCQTHGVVAVHVGQEEEPCSRALPHLPEVDSQRSVRDDFTVDGHASVVVRDVQTCDVSDHER